MALVLLPDPDRVLRYPRGIMWRNAIPPNEPVIVMVVSQEGCGACEEYLPRFAAIAAPYAQQGLAIIHLDAADDRPEAQAWMDQVKVESTPTTYVLRHRGRGGGVWKLEGGVDDATIKQTLDFAQAMRS